MVSQHPIQQYSFSEVRLHLFENKAFLHRQLQENNSSQAYLSKRFHWYSVHERKKVLSLVVRQITPNVDFWRMPFFFKDFMRMLRTPNSYVVPIVTTIIWNVASKEKSTSFRKHDCIKTKKLLCLFKITGSTINTADCKKILKP